MSKWKLVAVAALSSYTLLTLAGCTVPADPEHRAYSAVSNDCVDTIRTGVGEYSDEIPPEASPSVLLTVAAGQRVDDASPLYLPIDGKLYVWAAAPDAPSIGDPQEVKLSDVELETLPSGATVFHVTVSGDMCPMS